MVDCAAWAQNEKLSAWIEEVAALCEPASICFYEGSEEEYQKICELLVQQKLFTRLNPTLRPNSFWCRTSADDVARVEECTFICSKKEEDAGPTNHWKDPQEMKQHLTSLFKGCMRGRVMYVVPFCMGPLNSSFSLFGIEITDSAYVVANMHLMTRVGQPVLSAFKNRPFIPCLHSVGAPLKPGEKDLFWPCNPQKRAIVHFPEEKSIFSFGSGYGGNALLGKKCVALRIASKIAKDEGWLAEHMLIMGVTNPQGKKKYFAAAFPSSCGKTNLAMLQPSLSEWKISCVGDDIAWMRWGKDGRLYAVNPEYGFFGVAPGTSQKSNPMALAAMRKNAIFTNVALTPDQDVWWEGLTDTPPKGLISWQGTPYKSGEKAAHPNARFTAKASQCPIIDPLWESPEGVPISAILFGGRRAADMPLVVEAFDWQHGVFLGASLSSETTAAAKGEIGKLRHDPFAMLPFCGYNMGDYFDHWLSMEQKERKMPKIYHVNWFKKDEQGSYLWPGYGDNVRVLEWIFNRCEEKAEAKESFLGNLPKILNTSHLNLDEKKLEELFHVDERAWKNNIQELKSYFAQFGSHLPQAISEQIQKLEQRLSKPDR